VAVVEESVEFGGWGLGCFRSPVEIRKGGYG